MRFDETTRRVKVMQALKTGRLTVTETIVSGVPTVVGQCVICQGRGLRGTHCNQDSVLTKIVTVEVVKISTKGMTGGNERRVRNVCAGVRANSRLSVSPSYVRTGFIIAEQGALVTVIGANLDVRGQRHLVVRSD